MKLYKYFSRQEQIIISVIIAILAALVIYMLAQ